MLTLRMKLAVVLGEYVVASIVYVPADKASVMRELRLLLSLSSLLCCAEPDVALPDRIQR